MPLCETFHCKGMDGQAGRWPRGDTASVLHQDAAQSEILAATTRAVPEQRCRPNWQSQKLTKSETEAHKAPFARYRSRSCYGSLCSVPFRSCSSASVPLLLHRLSCIIIVASLTARELFKSHTEKWRKRRGGGGEASGEVSSS